MALSGHLSRLRECPLLGVKRTSLTSALMSAFDPKQTSQLYCVGHSSPAEGRANDLVRPRPISVAGELGLILKRMREHLHELLKRL